MPLPGLDYEKRTLDVVQSLLSDIRDCAEADYRVRWIDNAPHLILAFTLKAEGAAIPAFGVRLAKMPSGKLHEGDDLRRHVREAIEQYLFKHGVKVTFSTPISA